MFTLSAKYLAVKLLYQNKGPFIKVLTFQALNNKILSIFLKTFLCLTIIKSSTTYKQENK